MYPSPLLLAQWESWAFFRKSGPQPCVAKFLFCQFVTKSTIRMNKFFIFSFKDRKIRFCVLVQRVICMITSCTSFDSLSCCARAHIYMQTEASIHLSVLQCSVFRRHTIYIKARQMRACLAHALGKSPLVKRISWLVCCH